MSLRAAYVAGWKAAAEKFTPHPTVQRSTLLGGKGQAFDLSAMMASTSPAQVAQTFTAHEQASTKQDVERKVAADICTTCRKPKHYGPCKKPEKTAPAGAPLKAADFNPGLYGDRRDTGTAVDDEGPSMSPNYTAATSADSGGSRARPGNPQAQARTTFSDLTRFRDPMIASEWQNAYGALTKTCASVNFGPFERRGPMTPAHEEMVLRKGPPVAQGYAGEQTINHAFGQVDNWADSTNIAGGAGTPGGGPAVLG